jgi:hypothetical protein
MPTSKQARDANNRVNIVAFIDLDQREARETMPRMRSRIAVNAVMVLIRLICVNDDFFGVISVWSSLGA